MSTALQLALLRGEPETVSALIEFGATPSAIEVQRIFLQRRNRYRLRGKSADLWVASRSGDERAAGDSIKQRRATTLRKAAKRPPTEPPYQKASASASATASATASASASSHGEPQPGAEPADASLGADAAARAAQQARGRSRRPSLATMMGLGGDATEGDGQWAILCDWIHGYQSHVDARRAKNVLHPSWTDLMLWAVLTNEAKLVKPLWARSRDPLRAALLASQLCARLSALPHLRSEQPDLQRQSQLYEDWALALLDSIDDSETALPLLAMVPRIESGLPLWERSCLDTAADLEGSQLPCMRFVAHRHSQFLLEAFFSGDYPTSQARIPLHANLVAILLQSLLFFVPGTLCEVLPPSEVVREEAPTGDFSFAMMREKVDEVDDLVDEEEAILHAAPHRLTTIKRLRMSSKSLTRPSAGVESHENSWQDVVDDLLSHRWRTFFLVPKVKFVMYALFHVLHLSLLCWFVFPSLSQHRAGGTEASLEDSRSDPSHARNTTGVGAPAHVGSAFAHIEVAEVCFWLWTMLFVLAEAKEFKSFGWEGFRLYLQSTVRPPRPPP